MSVDMLWGELVRTEITRSSFFRRPLVTISKSEFLQYREVFCPHRSVLNSLVNYRSVHWWRHIHAIDYGDVVSFHIDHGNPSVSVWLLVPHLIFDVIPYFSYCVIFWKKPYYF
jgi:hypothetical protein